MLRTRNQESCRKPYPNSVVGLSLCIGIELGEFWGQIALAHLGGGVRPPIARDLSVEEVRDDPVIQDDDADKGNCGRDPKK